MTLIQNWPSMYSLNIPRNLRRAVLCGFFFIVAGGGLGLAGFAADEPFGPPNLLKSPNPFNTGAGKGAGESDAIEELGMIELSSTGRQPRRSLSERLNGPRLFLPDRMAMGRVSEFLVKGPPGAFVAIAMADKNKGAKAVMGHPVRLGADRKVVAVGTIPDTGVLSTFIESPIQGDLVGSSLYFEAAVWTKPDFSDVTICSCVTPLHNGNEQNGIVVVEDVDQQKKQGVFTFAPTRMHYSSDGVSGPSSSNTPY
jgi:hypothetical protein